MHDERAATVSITDRQLQVLELLDRRVPIKVGVGNGTRIQVLGGIKVGDKVVLPG